MEPFKVKELPIEYNIDEDELFDYADIPSYYKTRKKLIVMKKIKMILKCLCNININQ